MEASRTLLLLSLLSSAIAAQVNAQDPERTVYVTPWAGAFWSHSSGGDLPFVHGSGVVEAKMASSPALGVDVELGLPAQPLSIRGSLGLAFFSAVEFSNWDGELGSSNVSLGNPQGPGSSVLLLTASAVFEPWASPRLPYLVGGVGVKRYNYSTNMAGDLREALSSDRTRPSFQVGLGLRISRRLRLEVSDHISRRSFSFEVPQMERTPEPVRTQNDLIVALGYRLGPK